MKTDNIILDKSIDFSIRIVSLYQHLCDKKREYIFSKQIARSGTSIGANAHEAVQGYSKRDFIHKMNIALKESVETEYWLKVLKRASYISQEEFDSLYKDCDELSKILTAIIKTAKSRLLGKMVNALYSSALSIILYPLSIIS